MYGVNISLLLIQYSENLLRRPCVMGHSHNKCNIVSGSFLQKVHSGVSDKPILNMTLFVVNDLYGIETTLILILIVA